MAIPPAIEPSPAELCPPGEDQTEEYVVELDANNVVTHRMRTWFGRTIEFALIHLHLHDGEWHEIARVDSCHGPVHIHRFGRTEDGDRRRVEVGDSSTFEALEVGYERGLDLIYNGVEDNVRQWIRG